MSLKSFSSFSLPEPYWTGPYLSSIIRESIRQGVDEPEPVVVAEAISPETCEAVIRTHQDGQARRRSYQGLLDENLRNCHYTYLDPQFYPEFASSHLKAFSDRAEWTGARWAARPLVYEYPKGIGMVLHHDMVTQIEVERAEASGQPVVGGDFTLVWCLNDLPENAGGSLSFPEFNLEVVSRQGQLVVFRVDSIHSVRPILADTRYTVVARVFLNP